MSTFCDRAVLTGFRLLLRSDGREIRYEQGANVFTGKCLVDEATVEALDLMRVQVNREVWQFTVATEDFRDFSPRVSDRVTVGGRTFEVVAGPNKRAFDFADPGLTLLTFYGQKVEGGE